MVFDKDRLLEMGGIRPDPIRKWARLTAPAAPAPAAPARAVPGAAGAPAGGTR
jgi:hypothetical protein